jgi:hypothetical protein
MLKRGPYLQMQGPNQIEVCWRTDASVLSGSVHFGNVPDRLSHTVDARQTQTPFSGTKDWRATITELLPNQKYYYAICVNRQILHDGDREQSFFTAPEIGQSHRVRFWCLGDSGTNRVGTANPGKARRARDGFRRYNKQPINAMLMIGDHAYSHGKDAQYQSAFFDLYTDELCKTAIFPYAGNHDLLSDDFFYVFSVPNSGEFGGVPSRQMTYYSFDYANIHFVMLDLYKQPWRTLNTPQMQWLEEDLASTSQDWIIVVNHIPAFCHGRYNSDEIDYYRPIQQTVLPLLDKYGIDLHLSGHDHTYQRSYLINGHYGTSDSFDPVKHIKFDGDGINEPIVKKHGAHSGIVHVISGTAGSFAPADESGHRSGTLGYPAMVKFENGDENGRGFRRLGTFLLTVDGLELRGTQIDDEGQILDNFRIRKIP